ncbi:MAG: HD domain-containing protein [Myxococcales bacterium]|nr:HD domain-containing protein [Myxococcales bacterium]
MTDGRGLQSLFRQDLDRALVTSYLVGAVLPVLVLAVAYLLAAPAASSAEGLDAARIAGLAAGTALLSLSGFFAMRRLARRAVTQRDADNARLARLLATARTLATSEHTEEIAAATADSALALCGADAAFVLERDAKRGDEFALVGSAGASAGAIYGELEHELADLAAGALEQRTAAHMSFDRATTDGRLARGTAVVVPVRAESARIAVAVVRVGESAALFDGAALDALDTLCGIGGVATDNADLRYTQRNFFAHVTDLLVTALDAHVDRRDGHAPHVAELAHRVGRELGFDDEALRRLHFAALLHDVGMLKIARDHQRDPAWFRKHSLYGARMLSRIRVWREAAPIVLAHHEHFDGSGYPNGLVADAIPIESRVILVVDAFDAMTRDDTHRRARPVPEALQELRDGMGGQFDPAVVRAFLDLAQRGEIDLAAR